MFVVIEIQKTTDGSISNLVWAFADRDEAFSKYHAVLSAAAISSLPVHSCAVLFENGEQIAQQSFKHGEQAE